MQMRPPQIRDSASASARTLSARATLNLTKAVGDIKDTAPLRRRSNAKLRLRFWEYLAEQCSDFILLPTETSLTDLASSRDYQAFLALGMRWLGRNVWTITRAGVVAEVIATVLLHTPQRLDGAGASSLGHGHAECRRDVR